MTTRAGDGAYSEPVQANRISDRNAAPVAEQPVILPLEVRIRMTRLYEEVLTRIEEMAMILTRTLKMTSAATATVKFCPLADSADGEFTTVEILSTPQGRGCYDYRDGACFGLAAETAAWKQEP